MVDPQNIHLTSLTITAVVVSTRSVHLTFYKNVFKNKYIFIWANNKAVIPFSLGQVLSIYYVDTEANVSASLI